MQMITNFEGSVLGWPCKADFDTFAGYDRYIVTLIHHGLCSTNEDTRPADRMMYLHRLRWS